MQYVAGVWKEFLEFVGGRGGALHLLLFLAALAVCFFLGKQERKRLFWPSVLVLIFFFNPLFYKYVGMRFLGGVYWRLLWMLPISFVIAYALTRLVDRIQKNVLRVGAIILACFCIILTGEPIFSQTTYQEKQNEYELPQAAIEISDYVEGHLMDWKETIIVPNELLCSIRQYSSAACLLYGRNSGGFISDIGEDEAKVFAEMSKEEPDIELVTRIALEKNCRYIVFNTSFHQIPGDLTKYGYQKATVVEDVYAIYCRIE